MNKKNDMNTIIDNIINRLPVILSFDLFLYKRYRKPKNNNIDISRLILMFIFFVYKILFSIKCTKITSITSIYNTSVFHWFKAHTNDSSI